MLLAVDIGNSNTVFGLFDGVKLREQWRLQTDLHRLGDEWGVLTADRSARPLSPAWYLPLLLP